MLLRWVARCVVNGWSGPVILDKIGLCRRCPCLITRDWRQARKDAIRSVGGGLIVDDRLILCMQVNFRPSAKLPAIGCFVQGSNNSYP